MLGRMFMIARVAVLAAITCSTVSSMAQTYPNRPIRWVIAYGPGGGSDFLARTAGAQLAKQIGQPVVVENKPGGGGMIAAEAVAKSPADGYTIFTGDNGTLVYNPVLFRKLSYDPATDFTPVAMMARFPIVLITNNDSGLRSGAQAIDEIRARPGFFSFGSPGVGSPMHLAMELLKERARLNVLHVAYRGSGPGVQDLMGGQIPLMLVDSAVALPLVRAGRVKALIVFSGNRMTSLPEVPTVAELGISDVEAYAWLGLVVPAKTSGEVVGRLSSEIKRALESPEVAPKLTELGVQLAPSDSAGMKRYVEAEVALWQPLIRSKGIALD